MAHRLCPWWIGYFLMNPLRRFAHNPLKILGPYVSQGMTVLELGPGMGFFTLDAAKLVGAKGKVVVVDVQPRMLKAVEGRASRAGLRDRIDTRLGGDASWVNGLEAKVDFAFAIYMMHEVPDVLGLLGLIRSVLVPTGMLLLVEPIMHVSASEFDETVAAAEKAGFEIIDRPGVRRSRSVLLEKK